MTDNKLYLIYILACLAVWGGAYVVFDGIMKGGL